MSKTELEQVVVLEPSSKDIDYGPPGDSRSVIEDFVTDRDDAKIVHDVTVAFQSWLGVIEGYSRLLKSTHCDAFRELVLWLLQQDEFMSLSTREAFATIMALYRQCWDARGWRAKLELSPDWDAFWREAIYRCDVLHRALQHRECYLARGVR